MKNDLKQLRKVIRDRWHSDREGVVKEFLQVMETGDRQTKRLYYTALVKDLYDVATQEAPNGPTYQHPTTQLPEGDIQPGSSVRDGVPTGGQDWSLDIK